MATSLLHTLAARDLAARDSMSTMVRDLIAPGGIETVVAVPALLGISGDGGCFELFPHRPRPPLVLATDFLMRLLGEPRRTARPVFLRFLTMMNRKEIKSA